MKMKTFLFFFLFIFLIFLRPLFAAEEIGTANAQILAKAGEHTLTADQFTILTSNMPAHTQALLEKNPDAKKDIIENWIDQNILAQEAQKLGYLEKKEVNIILEQLKNQYLADEVVKAKVSIIDTLPEEDCKKFYEENPHLFRHEELVKARHILIRLPKDEDKEAVRQAKETIALLQKRLKKGESFAVLAMEHSQDRGSKNRGGDLGYFTRGQMIKEFEDVAFSTPVSQVSKPIKTSFGWHLILVTDKKEAGQTPYPVVKKQIEKKLIQQKNKSAISAYLETIKGKYQISYSLD